MLSERMCTCLDRRHFLPHTCKFQCCCPCGSLSAALRSLGLNERRGVRHHKDQVNVQTGSHRAAYPVLQWPASHLRSLLSTHKREEWTPDRIYSAGRLCRLSPRCLQPNTWAWRGELIKQNQLAHRVWTSVEAMFHLVNSFRMFKSRHEERPPHFTSSVTY